MKVALVILAVAATLSTIISMGLRLNRVEAKVRAYEVCIEAVKHPALSGYTSSLFAQCVDDFRTRLDK